MGGQPGNRNPNQDPNRGGPRDRAPGGGPDANSPGANAPGAPLPAGGGPAGAQPSSRRNRFSPEMRAEMELARKKMKFLADEGAALLVDCSTRGDGGTLVVQDASIPGAAGFPVPGQAPPARRVSPWDKDAPKIPPQIVVAKEHYNRLVRMIEQGEAQDGRGHRGAIP